MEGKIKSFEISNLWGKYNLNWNDINENVNILVGINGGGKSTLLKVMRDCILLHSKTVLKKYNFGGCRAIMQNGSVFTCGGEFGDSVNPFDICVEYINIFEPTNIGKLKKDESILDNQLDRLLYQRDANVDNFTNFRLKASVAENSKIITDRINMFFGLVNKLFQKTDKQIEIACNNIDIQFRDSDNNEIPIRFLSSGEKQMLIIMLKIFLYDNRPLIALFDEPETSLHIEWQHEFISVISKLNPNMQIIISTHSPSIFGDGWNDKLVFIEDLVTTSK